MQLTVQYKRYNFHFLSNVRFIDNSTDCYFLPCREKAHDSNEFCRENQKPCRESRITAC